MSAYAVIIPAYRPTDPLLGYIESLIEKGAAQVIVVNDGSGSEFDRLFEDISTIEGCTLLWHEKNKGKGAALKTAFRYFLQHFSSYAGVVTADADGQHAVKDVLHVGKRLMEHEEGFILGMRTFRSSAVPARSLLGNTVTTYVFKFLFGYYIRDTQTGLRGISANELDWVTKLRGERYEYEINMLINIAKRRKTLIGVDIQTIYHNHHVSYYNTYRDSLRIVWQLLRGYFMPPYKTEMKKKSLVD